MPPQTKTLNILNNFVVSGVKTVGAYTYVLLISTSKIAIIKRIKSDDSEIKFHEKLDSESIETFWTNPQNQTPYVWVNKL